LCGGESIAHRGGVVLLSKAEIARLIPHGGPMCLLDGVVRWDASSIRCASRSHRDQDNPMRAGDLEILSGRATVVLDAGGGPA